MAVCLWVFVHGSVREMKTSDATTATKKTALAVLPCRVWWGRYRELYLPTDPSGYMAWPPDRDCSPNTPAMVFSCPRASRQELVPARKGKQELGVRRLFSPQPNQEEKGICQTADFSHSAMLLTVTEPGTPLSGTPLHEDSIFPFRLEGTSVLWPPPTSYFPPQGNDR